MGKKKDAAAAPEKTPGKPKTEKTRAEKPKRPKAFRLELGWRGLFGLLLVSFCLFLWMFLLGLWAGQTIFLPVNNVNPDKTDQAESRRKNPAPSKTIAAP